MGGRGSSSGTSKNGNSYGSQYHAILTSGNIKFVEKNTRQSETLMETMTRGRVYVQVGGDDLKSIVYFDNNNMRSKQIDLDHSHFGSTPHVHEGYLHSEFRKNLSTDERKMVDRVMDIWYNRRSTR